METRRYDLTFDRDKRIGAPHSDWPARRCRTGRHDLGARRGHHNRARPGEFTAFGQQAASQPPSPFPSELMAHREPTRTCRRSPDISACAFVTVVGNRAAIRPRRTGQDQAGMRCSPYASHDQDPGTFASRGTHRVGNAVIMAATEARAGVATPTRTRERPDGAATRSPEVGHVDHDPIGKGEDPERQPRPDPEPD